MAPPSTAPLRVVMPALVVVGAVATIWCLHESTANFAARKWYKTFTFTSTSIDLRNRINQSPTMQTSTPGTITELPKVDQLPTMQTSTPGTIAELSKVDQLPTTQTNTPATTTELTEFTLFPELPPELRRNVWRLVCYQARVVTIQTYEDVHWLPNNAPPAILQVNAESREIGLSHYLLGSMQRLQKETYINFEVDIIYVASQIVFQSPNTDRTPDWKAFWEANGWLKKVRRLAVPMDEVAEGYYDLMSVYLGYCLHKLVKEIGPHMENLEELVFVDESRAGNRVLHRNLIPLNAIDIVPQLCMGRTRAPSGGRGPSASFMPRGIPPEVMQVKLFLEWAKEEIRTFVSKLKEGNGGRSNPFSKSVASLDWTENFAPDFTVMQLRECYSDGIEGNTPRPKPERDGMREVRPIGPIHLGKLRKIDEKWTIVRC